jgi:hypothetical protein
MRLSSLLSPFANSCCDLRTPLIQQTQALSISCTAEAYGGVVTNSSRNRVTDTSPHFLAPPISLPFTAPTCRICSCSISPLRCTLHNFSAVLCRSLGLFCFRTLPLQLQCRGSAVAPCFRSRVASAVTYSHPDRSFALFYRLFSSYYLSL